MILGCTLAALPVGSWFVLEWDETANYPSGLVICDDAGNPLRVTLGPGDVDCRPTYVADPEDWIVKALIASEDGSFWTHRGVRPLSLARATVQNLFYRRRISGASTITMQTVRLIKPHPKTLWEKYKEAVYALKMERVKDKTWILTQYLNRAPFGSNFVGIEAAANGWFGKGAKALGLGEAALLAGLVQAPSRFRPDRGLEKALKRRDYVLGRMLELHLATEEQVAAAKTIRPVVVRQPRAFKAPFFCDWVLSERPGAQGVLRTALNADIQATVERALSAVDASLDAAALVLDVRSGEVVAMATNGDYFSAAGGQVNTAVCPRPAGSTLKPFLAALAIDRGLVTPETLLVDEPTTYRGYRPANFDGLYRGRVSLRDALVLSLNVPFVRLGADLGMEDFADVLRRLGFRHLNACGEDLGLGLTIGSGEVTLLELARAYRSLASGGAGVFSPRAASLVAEMLSGSERSSAALGHIAEVDLPRFAWKTGTSSAYRDAWTLAWNPEYVIGVWCGHKTGGFGDTRVVGATAAAPRAWEIARALYPRGEGPCFAPVEEAGLVSAPRRRLSACEPSGLRFLKPEDGAVFRLLEGEETQALVCRVAGVEETTRLWWFVDGASAGETIGHRPFVAALGVGRHEIRCVTEDSAAQVKICHKPTP